MTLKLVTHTYPLVLEIGGFSNNQSNREKIKDMLLRFFSYYHNFLRPTQILRPKPVRAFKKNTLSSGLPTNSLETSDDEKVGESTLNFYSFLTLLTKIDIEELTPSSSHILSISLYLIILSWLDDTSNVRLGPTNFN